VEDFEHEDNGHYRTNSLSNIMDDIKKTNNNKVLELEDKNKVLEDKIRILEDKNVTLENNIKKFEYELYDHKVQLDSLLSKLNIINSTVNTHIGYINIFQKE